MTETSTIAICSNELDIVAGTCGSILPGNRVKLIDPDGHEITQYDTPGEVLLQGPSVVLGYLHNAKANAETFVWDNQGRWIRTGDVAMVGKSPAGDDVFFIVDRIKELIKTKVGPQNKPERNK